MEIPDNQKIAIYQNDKPVGLVECVLSKPKTLHEEITVTAWHGVFLGEEIAEQSPNEVYRRARQIAKEKGLRRIHLEPCHEDVITLYTPAFEE